MICKKCREQIDIGEPSRAEPVEAGSRHHVFYHMGCYAQVKEERQRTPAELERIADQARRVH